MQDEVTHAKLELVAATRALKAHDPAMGRRKREKIQRRIDELNEEIRKRSSQIYALMDAVEGQKEAGQLQGMNSGKAGEDGEGDVQREVEETLLSVGVEPAEARERARSGRRVVVQSFHGESSDEESEEGEGSESSQELPWEGLSDEESGIRG